jgi:hypothetical protein
MNHTEPKQPFFARFLETQNKKDQDGSLQLTNPLFDSEPTLPLKDGPYTDKYPSDWDEA